MYSPQALHIGGIIGLTKISVTDPHSVQTVISVHTVILTQLSLFDSLPY